MTDEDLVRALRGEMLKCECAAHSSSECVCDAVWPEHAAHDAADAIERLTRERDEARRECEEQARLNGIGSERELTLMAQRDAAERKVEMLKLELLHWKYEVTNVTDFILAKQMWDAYAEQAGGKTWDGKPLPTWDELGEERQSCWLAAAAAARAALKETDG